MKINKNIINILHNSKLMNRITPSFLREYVKKKSNYYLQNFKSWKKTNEFIGTPYEFSYIGDSKETIGIIFDFTQRHVNYMRACHEMKVSYEVVDVFSNNWYGSIIKRKHIDKYVVWPTVYSSIWKEIIDERISIIQDKLKKIVMPDSYSIWLYESKRRNADWFKMNNIKIPETNVFYKYEEAYQYLLNTSYPLVFKTDLGAGATGVKIFDNKSSAIKFLKKVFYKSFIANRMDPRDSQWGHALFQEHINIKKEWRVARIGNSYFVREKIKVGKFHSGSGNVKWRKPNDKILNLARKITDLGNFTSMAVDIFEDFNENLFVNEMHTVFGVKEIREDENTGKWTYDGKFWNFEQGYFSKNQFANERIKLILEL